MTDDRARRALQLFELALSLPEDRIAAFLDDACDDAVLRADVESLLSASRDSGELLPGDTSPTPTVSPPTTGESSRPGCEAGRAGPLEPGTVILARYAIRETLGSGGMGTVYRAEDSRLERSVAIKALAGAESPTPETRERFAREARAVASFSHPNVVEIFDVGEHQGVPLAVMELVEGSVLRALLGGPLPLREATNIAAGVAAGLAAAHERGLMHRDIKPENIMIAGEGHVKILDFGLARPPDSVADPTLTRTSMRPGTVPYMSPEQAAGENLGSATDIFSLGTVLHEMLTGTNPFLGASIGDTLRRVLDASAPRLSSVRHDAPRELEELVARMLLRAPDDRPGARDIARQLRSMALDPARAESEDSKRGATRESPRPPETRYARCGDIHIAYQAFGDGPIDLLVVPGFISNVDNSWASPECSRWLRAFGRFARVATFDKRGTGLSDRVDDLPSMEERIEDVVTVMDAVGFDSAALLGISEGGSLATVFAATYPQRCRALILHGSFARFTSWFATEEALEGLFDYIRSHWGSGESLPGFAPSMAGDAAFRDWWGRFERLGANPGAAIRLMRMNSRIDISRVLPSVQAPTLVLRRAEDVLIDPDAGQHLADEIPDARLFTSPGRDHIPWVSDAVDGEIEAVREFLERLPAAPGADTVLATILAVRLGSSSELAAASRRAEDLLARHRGRRFTSRDGALLATFEGPVRAIRCARSIASSLAKARLSVHTGEVQVGESEILGPAVDTALQIADRCRDGELLVSGIVKDLVAESTLLFEEAPPSAQGDLSVYRIT